MTTNTSELKCIFCDDNEVYLNKKAFNMHLRTCEARQNAYGVFNECGTCKNKNVLFWLIRPYENDQSEDYYICSRCGSCE